MIRTLALLACASACLAADYPQWGGSPSRNNVITGDDAKTIPLTWNVGEFDFDTGAWNRDKSKHIKWVARLGSASYGNPTVAGGKVFVGTNNEAGYLARFPKGKVDLGVLLCFNEADGDFLWQYSSAKLATGDKHDYAAAGICSSPLIDAGRVYFLDNRCRVVCLDAEGFLDGENDGINDEENENKDEADVIWRFDMMKELGVEPVFMTASSVTAHNGLLFVHTCNSADELGRKVPRPDAPSFIGLRQRDGGLEWKNAAPGGDVLHGSWSSPAVHPKAPNRTRGTEAIFAGGDGWLYGFRDMTERGDLRYDFHEELKHGRWRLLWRFDCNRKMAQWKDRGEGDRTSVIATPVIHDDQVFIATGQITEHADTPAALLCVDLAKARASASLRPKGADVSEELVFNAKHDDGNTPIPHKRTLAADPAQGDIVKRNEKSALVWRYTGEDLNKNGKLDVAEVFHRCIGNAAARNDLVIAVDFTGVVHCVDAATGKAHWTHDMLAGSWSSPLIVEDRIYICSDHGDVFVFALSKEKKILAENDMGGAIYSTPIVANGVMYVMTKSKLFAVTAK